MIRIGTFFLSVLYLFSLQSFAVAEVHGTAIKIQFAHSHVADLSDHDIAHDHSHEQTHEHPHAEQSHQQTHHNVASEMADQSPDITPASNQPQQAESHHHDLLIGSAVLCLLPANVVSDFIAAETQTVLYPFYPRAYLLSLSSGIFRPPIA